MRLSTRISCIKNGPASFAMAKLWRWQSGGAAAKEERREWVARKGSEFEIKDYHVPVACQTPSPDNNYFSKTWDTHKTPFAVHTSTNNSSGDQGAGFAPPWHKCPPCQPANFQNHDHALSIRRDWQYASHSTQTLPQESFVITSFNILASEHAYTHRSLYPSVPTNLLAWSRRRRKVLHHLGLCSPDIICLQEVDQFKDLQEDLALSGYTGFYKGRTGEMPDGCAIFWRKKRFQLLQERSFEFAMLGMRNNVAQLCALQLIVPGLANDKSCSSVFRSEGQTQSHHRLVVGNIHLLFNPRRGEMKLGQCRAFLEQVHYMSSIWHGAPVVIGGDFNSTPSSAVYKYLATSELDLSNLDRRYLSGLVSEVPSLNANKSRNKVPSLGRLKETVVELTTAEPASQKECTPPSHVQTCYGSSICSSTEGNSEHGRDKFSWNWEELRMATGKPDCTLMQHELNLYSAYSDVQGNASTRDAKGEPLVTTCHKDFLGTVDYIWRNDGLKTIRVLETVPVKALAMNKGLPIKVWGSDHLALACELAFSQHAS